MQVNKLAVLLYGLFFMNAVKIAVDHVWYHGTKKNKGGYVIPLVPYI